MKSTQIIIALLELGLATLIGVMILYGAYSLLNQTVFKKYDIKKDNVAFAILISAILFAAGNIVSGVIEPIGMLMRQLNRGDVDLMVVTFNALKYIFAFLFIAITIAFITVTIAIKLFTTLTKIEEFDEIANNNISTAIITGTIAIIISIFAKIPAMNLMNAIIPFPKLFGIN